MRKMKITSMFVLLALLLTFVPSMGLAAEAASEVSLSKASGSQWTTYTDPLYDFSFRYPKGWQLIPRNDLEGMGGVVQLIKSDDTARNGSPAKIEIGFYLQKRGEDESLNEWLTNYLASFSELSLESQIFAQDYIDQRSLATLSTESGNRDNAALYVKGSSELTEYQYVNIPRGDTVWFIWTNEGTVPVNGAFNTAITSFEFGPQSPKDFQESLNMVRKVSRVTLPEVNEVLEEVMPMANEGFSPPGFRLPFIGYKNISVGPGCYYTHQGNSFEAIDYSMAVGTMIVATKNGTVSLMGYYPTGWGNLLMTYHPIDYMYAYYAHLSSYRYGLSVGSSVYRGYEVARSGDTGNSTGPHLHFEVRKNGSSVWIRTLATTVWDSGSAWNPCYDGNGDGYYGYAVGPGYGQ